MVDPSPDSASRDLPLVVYEETVSVANDRMSSAFVRSNFELKTDEVIVLGCNEFLSRLNH